MCPLVAERSARHGTLGAPVFVLSRFLSFAHCHTPKPRRRSNLVVLKSSDKRRSFLTRRLLTKPIDVQYFGCIKSCQKPDPKLNLDEQYAYDCGEMGLARIARSSESIFCSKRKLRIIVPTFGKTTESDATANDAFSRKVARPKLAFITVMLALAVFGVVPKSHSATLHASDPYATDFWRKQANWVAVGVFAFMLTSLVHYRWILGALPMYRPGSRF